MKIILMLYHLLAFLLLVTAAALQINDPDPLLWVGFFFLCALIPLLAVFKVEVRMLYILCAVYGIVVLIPTIDGFLEYLKRSDSESLVQGMSMDKPYIEEARELMGTLIAIGLITISMFGRKWAAITHLQRPEVSGRLAVKPKASGHKQEVSPSSMRRG